MGRATERMATRGNSLNIPQLVKNLENATKIRVEKVSSVLTYYGQADRGTAESAAGWFVSRISKSGAVSSVDLASTGFDQVWDDRASLVYE